MCTSFMHPAPLLAYPSGLGNPKVDPSLKKKGAKRQMPTKQEAPKKKKTFAALTPGTGAGSWASGVRWLRKSCCCAKRLPAADAALCTAAWRLMRERPVDMLRSLVHFSLRFLPCLVFPRLSHLLLTICNRFLDMPDCPKGLSQSEDPFNGIKNCRHWAACNCV